MEGIERNAIMNYKFCLYPKTKYRNIFNPYLLSSINIQKKIKQITKSLIKRINCNVFKHIQRGIKLLETKFNEDPLIRSKLYQINVSYPNN